MERGAEIRSFKVRAGRLGPTSQDALERLWPRYGIDPPYGDLVRSRPLVLEIGFGMGEATALMAAAAPEVELLAVEVHPAGIAALLRRLEDAELSNVRVVDGDAVPVLAALPERSLAEVRIFFPDPWPKARHAKRRLFRPSFAELVASRLERTGILHLATDWPAYAEHALESLAERFSCQVVPRPENRPMTGYERRALTAGRPPIDVIARPRLA